MGTISEHTGSCHCGKVKFKATFDASQGMTCNCSICARRGTILGSVPADQFTLVQGEGAQTEYQFGKKKIHHFFCPTCGVAAYSQGVDKTGKKLYAVNLRCLEDFDLEAVKTMQYDGKAIPLHND